MKFVDLLHQMIDSHGFPAEVAQEAHDAVKDFVDRFDGLFRIAPADDLAAAMATPDVSRETSPVAPVAPANDSPKGADDGAQ